MLKNEGDFKNKSFGSKSKKGDMKRSSSKKSPNASNQDFNPAVYSKFGHPNGIGLYGPGKIKLSKEKPSSSSRGSARWNKSPSHQKVNGSSKGNMFEDIKTSKPENENSFAYSKAAINNFMNNSQNKADITPNNENDEDSTQINSDNNKRKKSNSKLNTFGNPKNSVLKELLQMKQDNNKLFKAYAKDHNDLIEDEGVQPAGNALK